MRGVRLVLLLACVLAGVLAHPGAAAARRVALVVGNGAYRSAPALANPPNDARDVAHSLRGLGFEVTEGIDLDKAGMEAALRRFAAALHRADVGLFYYSGHGLAVGDKNYLVPVDAQIDRASDLDFATVPLDLVTRVLDDEPRTALVFLDACRDNPLARSLARSLGASRSVAVQGGLVSTGAGTGTLIAYATQPGNTASDGAGRNSPFTSALLRHIGEPGVEVRSMLTRVRRDVLAATDGTQEPWDHSSLTDEFYFAPQKAAPQQAGGDLGREEAFWRGVADSRDPQDLQAYLKLYPGGLFADLAKRRLAALGGAQPATPPAGRAAETPATPPPVQTAQLEAPHAAAAAVAPSERLMARKEPLLLAARNGFGACGVAHLRLAPWHKSQAPASRVPDLAGAQPVDSWASDTSGVSAVARTFAESDGGMAVVAFAQVDRFEVFNGNLGRGDPELCYEGGNSPSGWSLIGEAGPTRIAGGWRMLRGFNVGYTLVSIPTPEGARACTVFDGTRNGSWIGGYRCGRPGEAMDKAGAAALLDRIRVSGVLDG